MNKLFEVNYLDLEQNEIYIKIIENVITKCFEIENLINSKLYVNIILTNKEEIKKMNTKYRNIDKETDVLSFPIFEKAELDKKIKNKDFQNIDILGDMIICIPKVEEQAIEYEHSFERELAYMIVHSFYHLIGYDHIKEKDKQIMREKEEFILSKLNIKR